LPADIPDLEQVFVSIPVELNAGCGCTVDNVAIAIGIDHTNVGDLDMGFTAPDGDGINLVSQPSSSASLVSTNKITFDDSTLEKDPLTLGDTDPIPADSYNAQGSNPSTPGTYPDPNFGLGIFNGKVLQDLEGGDWTFVVNDFLSGNTGTIESVELTITCAE